MKRLLKLLAVVGLAVGLSLESEAQQLGNVANSFQTFSNVTTYINSSGTAVSVTNSTTGLTNQVAPNTTLYTSNLFNTFLFSDTYHTNGAFGPNTNGGIIPLPYRYITIEVTGTAPAGTFSNTLQFSKSVYTGNWTPLSFESSGSVTSWTFNTSAAGSFSFVKTFECDADSAWQLQTWTTGTNAAYWTNPIVAWRTKQ